MAAKRPKKKSRKLTKEEKAYIDKISGGQDVLLKADAELFRMQMREQRLRQEASKKRERDACSHRQGCNPLSVCESSLTSIVWHYQSGIWHGFCTNCNRHFTPDQEDYSVWIKEPTGNRPSGASVPLWPNYPEDRAKTQPQQIAIYGTEHCGEAKDRQFLEKILDFLLQQQRPKTE